MGTGTVRHIFFVDDEPKVRMVVRKTLAQVGVAVTCFGSAQDCLARLEEAKCDLLIADVRMPRMDGLELLIEVKRRWPWLPVLVVTGYGDVPMAVRALRAGAADFIEKPLDRDAFLDAVDKLLHEHADCTRLFNHSLTKMEMRVLDLILDGKNTREIAILLHRSVRTIEVHRSHVMRKMGATGLVELLRRSADLGLLGPSLPPREDGQAT